MSDHQHCQHHASIADKIGGGDECVLCPVCVLLQAVSASRPEVTEHLLAAGRELTRAVTVLLDADAQHRHADDEGVQRIHVD